MSLLIYVRQVLIITDIMHFVSLIYLSRAIARGWLCWHSGMYNGRFGQVPDKPHGDYVPSVVMDKVSDLLSANHASSLFVVMLSHFPKMKR